VWKSRHEPLSELCPRIYSRRRFEQSHKDIFSETVYIPLHNDKQLFKLSFEEREYELDLRMKMKMFLISPPLFGIFDTAAQKLQ
jgi:hypothetical protein